MGGCRSTPPFCGPPPPEPTPVLRRQSSAAATTGRTHQNTSFVECGRSARPHSTKLGCFAVFGSRRLARPCWSGSLRSGRGLSCAPGPRSAARPCPAPPFVSPSPLGRLRTVVGGPPPPGPLPLRGRGCGRLRRWRIKPDDWPRPRDGHRNQDTASAPPPRIREDARGPGPRPIGSRVRARAGLGHKKRCGGARSTPPAALHSPVRSPYFARYSW